MRDVIISKLREKNLPVTWANYALFAYWRPYRKLSADERLDVREAVYQANLR